ncbi:hypothetical protein A8F94_09155 [Bacillus sp. FJAT-27225]|uniref:hypothetical protein n=1 Tax=Bacillus sp. FJAT-27225 TaxID=1743144 RepID=UPI00080C208D|nr:hypothetical protein [Bacillus sp. FJAT-27225]OCA87985.1 hypothetical protein A8F94_09155 [Bacillus sp. FJAT-27225]
MRKVLVLVMVAFMTGCSAPTLQEALEDSGREDTEVLYQDDENQIAIFASNDFAGQRFITMNTFSKSNRGYRYDGNGENAQYIEDTIGFKVLTISQPGDLEDW